MLKMLINLITFLRFSKKSAWVRIFLLYELCYRVTVVYIMFCLHKTTVLYINYCFSISKNYNKKINNLTLQNMYFYSYSINETGIESLWFSPLLNATLQYAPSLNTPLQHAPLIL